jgi:hypothetical protein
MDGRVGQRRRKQVEQNVIINMATLSNTKEDTTRLLERYSRRSRKPGQMFYEQKNQTATSNKSSERCQTLKAPCYKKNVKTDFLKVTFVFSSVSWKKYPRVYWDAWYGLHHVNGLKLFAEWCHRREWPDLVIGSLKLVLFGLYMVRLAPVLVFSKTFSMKWPSTDKSWRDSKKPVNLQSSGCSRDNTVCAIIYDVLTFFIRSWAFVIRFCSSWRHVTAD